jgi:hypothetical protein
VATLRQGTSGGYSIQVSEAELSLIKMALKQAERMSRFGMDVLDEADQSMDRRRLDRRLLRREIEALAIREASLRSLQKAIAETGRGQESA